MTVIFIFFITLQVCYASGMDSARDRGVFGALSATETGKRVFSAENASGFSSLKSWGISVNPDYQQSTNPQEIEEQASRTFNTDETAQLIKKSHQTRELVQIDLDHIQIDGDGLIKNMGDGHLDGEETYEIRTCRTPGEHYTAVCKRQRFFEVKVTPSTLAHVRHCGGHTESRAWGTKHVLRHYSDCGCGSYWTGSPRKVELMNERWVGCESEDRNHEDGLCELIEERPGPHNETRMIDGESFTRDYWETTRAYRCGARVENQ